MVKSNFYRVAVLSASLVWASAASSQQNILLEESSGPDRRPANAETIDINLGKDKPSTSSVRVDGPSASPTSNEAIVLKPGEFSTGAKATPRPTAAPAATATPAAAPVVTPAPAPAVSDDAKDLPVQGVTNEGDAASDGIGYLPPSGLAKEKFVTRGDQKLAMRPEDLKPAPLEGTVPDVFGTTLTNGLRFYHYESHDLPRVRVNLFIQAGSICDPAEKVGMASLMVKTMRSGGAAGRSGDEIDQQFEQIGSQLEFSTDRDNVSGSMFALTDKADQAMGLLADVLLRPEFDQKKFDQQKDQVLETLRRQNDEPADISRREFRKVIYGKDNPLSRSESVGGVKSISRDDIRGFHDARVRPSTVWIGISGDITRDDARKLVEKYFGEWNRPQADPAPVATVDEDSDSSAGVFLVEKATAQSQIRLGHFGVKRQIPETYAINVLNSIYGNGGFSSRLMNEVRTKSGFVYGVGGAIQSDDPTGIFFAAAASKSKTTGAAIKQILDVTRGLVDNGVTEQEMETARRDVFFTFLSQFDTPQDIVSVTMLYAYRGYPDGYLQQFPEKIKSVTKAQVDAAAKQFMHPDKLKIFVVGDPAQLDMPMDTFGSVSKWAIE